MFLYADDVCVVASSEEHMKVIVEQVNECVIGYDLKVNEKNSNAVCMYGKLEGVNGKMGHCYNYTRSRKYNYL